MGKFVKDEARDLNVDTFVAFGNVGSSLSWQLLGTARVRGGISSIRHWPNRALGSGRVEDDASVGHCSRDGVKVSRTRVRCKTCWSAAGGPVGLPIAVCHSRRGEFG